MKFANIWPGRLFAAALASIAAAVPATAADIAALPVKSAPYAPAAAEQWSHRFVSYGWLTGINGSQTVRGRTVNVDASFIDIVKDSDSIIAFMGYFEARKGPWGIFSDLVYSKLTASGGATRAISNNVSGTLGASLGVDYQMAIVTVGAAYEVARWGVASGARGVPASFTALDVIAGGRYWWQKVDVHLDVTGTINLLGLTISGNRATAKSGDVDWIDPFVGLRLRHQLAPGKELSFIGDIGGFGAGSKFSWQLVGAYGWEFCVSNNVTWAGVIGYRALYVDYSQGSGLSRFAYDILQHGPIIGVSARF